MRPRVELFVRACNTKSLHSVSCSPSAASGGASKPKTSTSTSIPRWQNLLWEAAVPPVSLSTDRFIRRTSPRSTVRPSSYAVGHKYFAPRLDCHLFENNSTFHIENSGYGCLPMDRRASRKCLGCGSQATLAKARKRGLNRRLRYRRIHTGDAAIIGKHLRAKELPAAPGWR